MQVPSSYDEAEGILKAGTHLTREQLAGLLEQHPSDPLPDVIRAYLIATLRQKPALPAGRKARTGAAWDFTIADMLELYEGKRAEFRAEDKEKRARAREKHHTLPKTDKPAHERAAEFVLEQLRPELGSLTVKRFQNMLSELNQRTVSLAGHIAPDEHDMRDTDPRFAWDPPYPD
jgi:hypothetical protein